MRDSNVQLHHDRILGYPCDSSDPFLHLSCSPPPRFAPPYSLLPPKSVERYL